MVQAILILDPTEGAPNLQEFAKRCQKIADICDKLEAAGWDIEADLSYEALVFAHPPHEVDNEEELISLIDMVGVDISEVGYPDLDEDFDDEDLDDQEDGYFDDDYDDFDDEDEDDDDDLPLMDQEESQKLIGKTISDVDAMFDTMTLKFDDGSKLIIDGYEVVLEE